MLVAVSMSATVTNMTCAEAKTAAMALAKGATGTDSVAVTGYVTSLYTSTINGYGQQSVYIDDVAGSGLQTFEAYNCYMPLGTSDQPLAIGDQITVKGFLKNYNNKIAEIDRGQIAVLQRSGFMADTLDVTFAEALTAAHALQNNVNSANFYRVRGVVSTVETSADGVAQYHNCDFLISDPAGSATETIKCYRTKWFGNTNMAAEDMPQEGDTVLVQGPLQYFQGNTVEVYQGYIKEIARYQEPATPQGESYTVRLFPSAVAESWEHVYVHAWNADGDMLGGWPGQEATLVDGWYSYTLPESASPVNIIWNNGGTGAGAEQTGDLTNLTSDLCYALGQKVGSQWYCMAIPCETGTEAVTCAAIATMPEEAVCKVNEVTVVWAKYSTYHNATFIFAQDATGPLTIQLSGDVTGQVEAGDRLNGLFGYKSEYFNLYIALSDLTVSHGVAPEIPVMSELPTAADVNKVFALEAVDMQGHTFTTSPSNYGVMLTDEIYLDLRNAWGDAFVFEQGKTYDMIGYLKGFDEYNYPQVWVSAFSEHQGEVVPPEPEDSIVLRVSQVSADAAGWNEVHFFVWGANSTVPSAYAEWPGAAIDLVDGWYTVSLPADLAPFNPIWNNGGTGGANQTENVYSVTASTCYSLRPQGSDQNYQALVVACDEPDVLPDTHVPHMVYFTTNLTRVAFDSIEVEYDGTAVLPTSLPEIEGYHFEWWSLNSEPVPGVQVDNIQFETYVVANYQIDLPNQTQEAPITVRLQASTVPADWEQVYIYSWTSGAMEVAWPGVAMELDAEQGWYYHTFPEGVSNIDFLFDNGDGGIGRQTVDINKVKANFDFRLAAPISEKGYYMLYLTESVPPQPVQDSIVVRLVAPTLGWENVYLFSWPAQGEIGIWPGKQITPDEDGWCSYTFYNKTSVNIIWNDGSNANLLHQTFNIESLDHSADFVLSGREWNEERESYMTTVAELAEGVSPSSFHTVAVIDLDFGSELLMIAQVPDGMPLNFLPEGPQHEGKIFEKWVVIDPTTFEVLGDAEGMPVTGDMLIDEFYDFQTFTVHILDWNGHKFGQFPNVAYGTYCHIQLVPAPTREGYEFIGWTDSLLTPIKEDHFVIALYRPIVDYNAIIQYDGMGDDWLGYQTVNLELPEPEEYEGYHFVGWEVVGGPVDIEESGPTPLIHIRAVYEEDQATGAPAVEGQAKGRKVFRDGTVYIIDTKSNTYTTAGQKVK